MSGIRRVVRGLGALLLMLVLLLGLPAMLAGTIGNPTAALPDLLVGDVTDAVLIALLASVAWVAWAQFALAVLAELGAGLLRIRLPRGVPGVFGGQQQLARSLVSAALLLGPVTAASVLTPAALSALPAPAAQASVSVLSAPDTAAVSRPAVRTQTQPATVVGAAASTSTSTSTYTIPAGAGPATLWDIAATHLGSGERWQEIWQLNEGRVQPGGAVMTSPRRLLPGWTVALPVTGTEQFGGSATPSAPGEQHVVQAGETLHGIAHEVLGPDADEQELYAANRERVQADGRQLSDPDLIQPGWVLAVPATEVPATGPPPAVEVPTVEVPAVEVPAVEVPAAEVEPPGTPTAEPGTDPAAAESVFPATRTASGVGGLLACSLLALLGVRRRRQARKRLVGERIPMPPPGLERTECELWAVQDPQSRLRVDLALRTLSVLLGEAGRSLPKLCLVRVQGQHLELYLADECVPPAPFTATDDPSVWALDRDAPLLSKDELADVAAPYPALVTIGHDSEDGHVLLDLEQSGALSVNGEQQAALAVVAALAAELATSDWADHVQVTLVGCFPELPDALGTGRVRYAPTLRAVLPELERHVADVRTVLRADGLRDLQLARTATRGERPHGDCWTPDIVLIAGPVEASLRDRLSAVLSAEPHGGVAAVMVDAGPAQWQLTLGAGTGPEVTAVLSPYQVELRPQRLTGPDLTELLALLAIASRPPTGPDGQVGAVPPELTVADLGRQLTGEPVAGMDTEWRVPTVARPEGEVVAEASDEADEPGEPEADGPPVVLVLGPVVVQGARGVVEEGKRRQLTEIAAFLALHPGADHHGFSEAIWPGARAVEQTRNTAMSKLRAWLGPEFVPRVSGGGYRLAPEVRTEWHQWQELMVAEPAATSSADLAAALDLVRGQPFQGHAPGHYAWSERGKQEKISAIGDAAHELATRALLAGDATLARRAAAAGVQVDPGNEMLWRDALRAEWLAGDRAGLEGTAGRLTALADDLDDELEPETLALLTELLGKRPVTAHTHIVSRPNPPLDVLPVVNGRDSNYYDPREVTS